MRNVMGSRRRSLRRTWRMQRVEAIDANPRTFEQRAAAFAAAVPDGGAVTLVVSRTASGGVVSQLTGPARLGDTGAVALAQAVGAKAVQLAACQPGASLLRDTRDDDAASGAGLVADRHGLVLPRAHVVGWCERDPDAPPAHAVQAGANPAEVARLLAGSLRPGQWVAVCLRPPRNVERRAWRRWLVHRLGTQNPVHHSAGSRPLAVSLLAGGPDVAAVTALLEQTVASLPGFDLSVRVRAGRLPWVRLTGTVLPALAVGAFAAAAATAGFAGRIRAGLQALLASGRDTGHGVLAGTAGLLGAPTVLTCVPVALALVSAAILIARLRGHGSSWPVLAARALDGVFPDPPRHRGPVRPPHREQPPDADGRGGRNQFDGDYPLHPAAFLVGPAVVAAVVAPQSGALSGSAETRDRGVPPAVLADIGPVIGHAGPGGGHPGPDGPDHALVHLSAADMGFGVAITGGPGFGKTKLLTGLWLASVLDRAQPSGRPGWPGRDNTMVAFDTKGDEVDRMRSWAALAGDRLDVVSVADPAGLAIDMFARHTDPVRAAVGFVDAMVYAFEDGSIMARSQETLTAVFAGALAADAETCARVPELGPVRHPVRLAHVLCGGAGETLAKELFGALRSEAARTADPARLAAVEKLKIIFEPFTSSAFRTATEAARNKLDALAKLGSWWDEDRPRIGWDEIITGHRSVVVDTGAGSCPTAGGGGGLLDERSGHLLAGMLMFGLWTAAKRLCSGWRDRDRWLSVFSDELAVQAASSAEPIAWLRDQGRSYGVRLHLATQRTEQLPAQVRDVFLTFPNLISFRQESVPAARSVAEQLSQGEDTYSADDIRNLAPFTAVCRLDVNRRLLPSFSCSVHHFDADPEETVRLLGYTPQAPRADHARADHAGADHGGAGHAGLDHPGRGRTGDDHRVDVAQHGPAVFEDDGIEL
ncbi:type IV secretory system conjugative DNA transfer family protein [Microlunatus ginsengisoli]|uniref:hypothetical protein n=1 Tax=Microlunatus ginsengisoli TaxID=363863 RepID=UPI0031D7ADCB